MNTIYTYFPTERIECPNCRKMAAFNEPYQLTSDPPQYSAHCRECGYKWSYSTLNSVAPTLAAKPETVNHPAHYAGKVECIDAIEAATDGLNGVEAFCTGNSIKYLFRWKKKNGLEDLKKARWYLDRLISSLEAKS